MWNIDSESDIIWYRYKLVLFGFMYSQQACKTIETYYFKWIRNRIFFERSL